MSSASPGSVDGEGRALRWVTIPIPLPPVGENQRFVVETFELLLCNVDGTAFVVQDRCPHVRTSMEGGLLHGPILECPMHGGRMDVRDGSPVAMPIRKAGVCFSVDEADGELRVGLPG